VLEPLREVRCENVKKFEEEDEKGSVALKEKRNDHFFAVACPRSGVDADRSGKDMIIDRVWGLQVKRHNPAEGEFTNNQRASFSKEKPFAGRMAGCQSRGTEVSFRHRGKKGNYAKCYTTRVPGGGSLSLEKKGELSGVI